LPRPPTIEEVAQLAGVSNMTVSRVVNASPRVSTETRDKVRAAMEALAYKPNAIAQGMRSNTTRTIGFLLPDLTNPFNAMIAQAVETIMAEAGLRTLVASTRFDLEREARYFEQFQANVVDGIIALLADETSDKVAQMISRSRVPVVVIDRDLPVPVDAVLCEHEATMDELVLYLVKLGHRRIGLINGPMTMRPARKRAEAFRRTAKRMGLIDAFSYMREPPPTIEDGFVATMDLMTSPKPPSCLVVCSNQNMFGSLRAIRDLALRIPEDVSFVGADENMSSALMSPPLTMISRDIGKMGEAAATLLLARLRDRLLRPGNTINVPSNLIFRESCGPASAARS
jgi:LacI family transcriptional regulator